MQTEAEIMAGLNRQGKRARLRSKEHRAAEARRKHEQEDKSAQPDQP